MIELLIIITYFIIYSFIGWLLESTYKSILQRKVVNSGFLRGPTCPIYGFGAIIMYLSLKDVTNNIIILFAYGIIILSIFEYIVGLFLEIVFNTKYWDYSKKKYNIHGRVCLQNSLYWGVLGVIFMRFIHPMIENVLIEIEPIYIIIFVSVLATGMLADTVTTVIGLIKINLKLKNLEEISEKIKQRIYTYNKEKLSGLKVIQLRENYKNKLLGKISNIDIEKRARIIGDLRHKQAELQEKLEKRLSRLRKAFPTMNSERLTNFLNNMKKS